MELDGRRERSAWIVAGGQLRWTSLAVLAAATAMLSSAIVATAPKAPSSGEPLGAVEQPTTGITTATDPTTTPRCRRGDIEVDCFDWTRSVDTAEITRVGNAIVTAGRGPVTGIDVRTGDVTWEAQVVDSRLVAASSSQVVVTAAGTTYGLDAQSGTVTWLAPEPPLRGRQGGAGLVALLERSAERPVIRMRSIATGAVVADSPALARDAQAVAAGPVVLVHEPTPRVIRIWNPVTPERTVTIESTAQRIWPAGSQADVVLFLEAEHDTDTPDRTLRLRAVDTDDGVERWTIRVTSTDVQIVDGAVIATTGQGVIAVDLRTGATAWERPAATKIRSESDRVAVAEVTTRWGGLTVRDLGARSGRSRWGHRVSSMPRSVEQIGDLVLVRGRSAADLLDSKSGDVVASLPSTVIQVVSADPLILLGPAQLQRLSPRVSTQS